MRSALAGVGTGLGVRGGGERGSPSSGALEDLSNETSPSRIRDSCGARGWVGPGGHLQLAFLRPKTESPLALEVYHLSHIPWHRTRGQGRAWGMARVGEGKNTVLLAPDRALPGAYCNPHLRTPHWPVRVWLGPWRTQRISPKFGASSV